ncbi:SCO family protein [Sphingobium sp. UBA5915]|uniref:SCO family protein n=1 Tax=Sphingobium sp. UBA5915 TaxID=1947530 RepID=UPI0025F3EF22|nr:SCO family protein [Sphingobium sp. UBA5915]
MTDIEPKDRPSVSARPRRTEFIIIGLVALLLGVVGVLVAAQRWTGSAPTAAVAVGPGGPFILTDTKGRTVTDRSMIGKPYAIFFGFTRCPDVCPTTLSRMTQLRKQLGPDGMKFNIVFVSVDPGHDKPEDIGNYLNLFPTPIIGLTGSDAQIKQITDAYRIYFARVPVEGGDYTIDHTAGVLLFDQRGKFVDMMDPTEPPATSVDRLRKLIDA